MKARTDSHAFTALVTLNASLRPDVAADTCIVGGVPALRDFGTGWQEVAQRLRPAVYAARQITNLCLAMICTFPRKSVLFTAITPLTRLNVTLKIGGTR